MKILLLNDFHTRGGAGIAAARLAGALKAAGHEVHWAVARANSFGERIHQYTDQSLPREVISRIGERFAPHNSTKREIERQVRNIESIADRIKPDVINVHNLHGAGLPATLPARLSQCYPVVWTLHDMWAFTGTCAYSFECESFTGMCTRTCPYHNESPASAPDDVPQQFLDRKYALEQSKRLTFVTPSQWLANQAGRGLLGDHPIQVIPNSVDLDTFSPIDRASAKRAIGISDRKPAILTFGDTATPSRKGAHFMPEVMGKLRGASVTWITIGSEMVEALPRSVKQINFNSISDPRLLGIIYNATDAFVLPTLADNLPNVLLEAAACGTPSIAFDVGGVAEALPPRRDEQLVVPGDLAALTTTIKEFVKRPQEQREAERKSIRAFAVKRFGGSLQAERYESSFAEAMKWPTERRAAA